MIHYNLTIKGRVQGVGFRYSTVEKARQLGVVGYVSNMPDGAVYIEAEGTEEILGDFIAWCRKGPSMAFVEDVKIETEPAKGYHNFEVKH
ncbi:acylphosphatase [Salinivirga cyanobacteriivorans]